MFRLWARILNRAWLGSNCSKFFTFYHQKPRLHTASAFPSSPLNITSELIHKFNDKRVILQAVLWRCKALETSLSVGFWFAYTKKQNLAQWSTKRKFDENFIKMPTNDAWEVYMRFMRFLRIYATQKIDIKIEIFEIWVKNPALTWIRVVEHVDGVLAASYVAEEPSDDVRPADDAFLAVPRHHPVAYRGVPSYVAVVRQRTWWHLAGHHLRIP